MNPITFDLIVSTLDAIEIQTGQRAQLTLRNHQPLALSSFPQPTHGDMPSMGAGQRGNHLWNIHDGKRSPQRALRARFENDRWLVHIDHVHPRRDPLGYLVRETKIPYWVALLALVGLLFGGTGALVGAAAGGLIGAQASREELVNYRLAHHPYDGWEPVLSRRS